MTRLILLFAAGGVGTLARYGLASLVQKATGGGLPYGTFVVNVLGCFLFGLVWTLAEERSTLSAETKFLLLTGFMGAFTTFSTFAFEAGAFVRESRWVLAAAHVAAHNIVGVVALLGGCAAGRMT